jgi:hypothetical protein
MEKPKQKNIVDDSMINYDDNYVSTENNYSNIQDYDLVDNSCVKFNSADFKKKYRKFVDEMNILVENIQLANQIIDVSNPGDKIDESLRMIMLNLKSCENNLLTAIQTQINDEKLLEICLKMNDDLNQSSERYNLLRGYAPDFCISLRLVN